jgi:hypothetical protein
VIPRHTPSRVPCVWTDNDHPLITAKDVMSGFVPIELNPAFDGHIKSPVEQRTRRNKAASK